MSSSGLTVMSSRTIIEKRYIIDLPYEAGGLEEARQLLAMVEPPV